MKSKLAYRVVAIVFAATLALMGILIFALPDREFSESENTVLSSKPALTLKGVAEGDWQRKLDQYLSDQFPLREQLISVPTLLRRALGFRDVNGAYFGENGRLFEELRVADIHVPYFKNNLAILERFFGAFPDADVTLLLVPDAGIVYPEDLPPLADYYDAEPLYALAKQTTGIAVCDVRDALISHAGEANLYYHTDHHWTTRGAYFALAELYRMWGLPEPAMPEFSAVTDSFLGTLHSKVLDPTVVPDRIEVPGIPEGIRVVADGAEIGVFDPEKLESKDKYQVFFGGNYGIVTVRNPAAKSEKRLLVLKDSYANCFVPMMTGEFSEIVMIDLRYYGGSVSELLSGEPFDRILVLYQLSSFAGADLFKLTR